MDVIGVIPARFSSTRFEGKVIADILGKPMIQHVYERAKQAKLLEDLIIATDNDRIIEVVKGFGGKVVFTSPAQPSGTDRLAEVVNPLDVRVIVNIQGDEPLVTPAMIDALAAAMLDDEKLVMATLVKKITDEKEVDDPNVVKVVVDRQGYALYFSRSRIPYRREAPRRAVYYKHIGIYAYTKDFLFTYTNLPESLLEKAESLEQLRVLEHGYRIMIVETKEDTVGVDTPDDIRKVEELLRHRK